MPTYASLVRRFGLAFRPDLPAYAYDEHANSYLGPAECKAHDDVVRAAFADFESRTSSRTLPAVNPYDAALAVWHEDGLLGIGDPGPPAFREAHYAYVARTVAARAESPINTSDVPEASDFARARLSYPRPRIALKEMLDVVDLFRAETHPLTLLHFENPILAMAGARAARERLVAWFAERGVDVDP